MPLSGAMNATLIIEQLGVMLRQEKTAAYKSYDYMNSKKIAACAADRQALCEWGYAVNSLCSGIDKSVVAVAISYFDRYLSSFDRSAEEALMDLYQFQLVFVSCLVIALKTHSGFDVETHFVSDEICNGTYEVGDISEMETEILRALQWRLNGPIPHDFVDGFLHVVPSIKSHQLELLSHYSKHIAIVGLTSYFVSLHSPSTIAYASICCALQYIDTVSTVDGIFILQFIKTLNPGLIIEGFRLRPLLNAMFCLVQESPPFVGNVYATRRQEDEQLSLLIAEYVR